jgi:uncharacterized protein YbaP (TraB family)
MMKNWLLPLFIAASTLSACKLFTKGTPAPDSSMLWKIEHEDLAHPTYILGTMHLINKEYFHFPYDLQKLVKNAKQLVMELDGLPDQSKAMQLMKLPDSVVMNDFFSEEQMALIYDFMEHEMKINKVMFDMSFGKLKPFFILQLIAQKQFKGETESYEMSLMSLAKKNKVPMVGLETIEQQIGFFDAIPAKEFGKMIAEYFTNADSLKSQTQKLQQSYRIGQLDTLAKFMVESSPELMEFEDILLTNRNIAWVPQVTELIFKKPSFIAVGAAHLAGDNGLINLLRKEGFTVTPVAF